MSNLIFYQNRDGFILGQVVGADGEPIPVIDLDDIIFRVAKKNNSLENDIKKSVLDGGISIGGALKDSEYALKIDKDDIDGMSGAYYFDVTTVELANDFQATVGTFTVLPALTG